MKKLNPFAIVLVALSGCCMALSAQTTEQIETQVLGHLNSLEKAAYRTGTGNFDALERENRLLRQELLKAGRQASILKYDFPALKEKMFISTSTDGKFRIYSWDNQEGGSGRVYENVFQYSDKSGKTHAWSPPAGGEGVVCASFYHQIFQIATPSGRVYLANSSAACSGRLSTQDLSAFRIDGQKLNTRLRLIKTSKGLANSVGIEYDFFSVVNRPERPVKLFFWDEAKKSFRFPVVIADEKTPDGRVTDKFITYKFNGRYFVKAS